MWNDVELFAFRKLAASLPTLLTMEETSPRLAYETPYLAKLAHSVPRFDMSLHRVNATFLLDSRGYKEVSIVCRQSCWRLKFRSHWMHCVCGAPLLHRSGPQPLWTNLQRNQRFPAEIKWASPQGRVRRLNPFSLGVAQNWWEIISTHSLPLKYPQSSPGTKLLMSSKCTPKSTDLNVIVQKFSWTLILGRRIGISPDSMNSITPHYKTPSGT